MRLSLNWLREYVDVEVGVDELCEKLTMLGLEIESVERPGDAISELYIGEIMTVEPHPNADRLSVCMTRIGEGEPLQIVCGATNMKPGDRVPTVVVGGELPGGFQIAKRKMRGVESQGMMCSPRELGMGEDHDGLLILSEDAPVGEDAKSYLGLDDVILEIEVTPNRGDWACMLGVARELAAAYGKTLREPVIDVPEGETPVEKLSSVTIGATDLCPRYTGRVIQGVKIGPSPDWLVKRLTAAGQRAINNVVDVTNYVMLETGQPLHAFDLDTLAEKRIVVRNARDGETIKTIDQEERKLSAEMLVIADAESPVAVAGVMGGFDTEVGDNTVNVFLESAFFHPPSVRLTSRKLGLISESSQRFQRGADPERVLYAANRAARLIQELAGGEVAAGVLDEYPRKLPQNEIPLRYARTNQVLGTTVAEEEQRTILTGLGFELLDSDEASATLRVPTWRHDCSLEADLIEEVARLHGYDNVPPALPRIRRSEDELAPHLDRVERLRNYLVTLGLTEAINWSFSAPEFVRQAGLDGDYVDMVPLSNPLSENHAAMRTTLIPGLLQRTSENIRKNRRDVALFELANVYRPAKKDEELPSQSLRLGVVLSGMSDDKHWSRPQYEYDFYDLKGYAEDVMEFFGLTYWDLEAGGPELYAKGQCGTVKLGANEIGRLGEVAHDVRDAFEIERPAFVMEFDLAPLLERTMEAPRFSPVPAYPPALRDLAVVVDRSAHAGELLQTAQKAGGKLLRDVHLFDVYTGKQVPSGKKSVALSLRFQSEERTLTDKDTQKAFDKIVRTLERQFGAELR